MLDFMLDFMDDDCDIEGFPIFIEPIPHSRCPICGAPCYNTPRGVTCDKGHRGVEPVIEGE